jgi:ATP phosphoribosyltransferase
MIKNTGKVINHDLSIAIPKGYLFDVCVDMLKKSGFDVSVLYKDDRKLFTDSIIDKIRYIICRPMDVPVYVEQGACDIGFCGKDVIEEQENNVIELMDLNNGQCRIIIATLDDNIEKVREKYKHFGSVKVATKYPNIAKRYFDKKGMQVEIIKLYGSIELAAVLGIADEILDITATGNTLRDNKLVEMDNVMSSTTRLIANLISYRTKFRRISEFIKNLNLK